MILYLLSDYHISFALGGNVLLIWSAATNFLPIVGAFLSDSLLMGMILLWLTTMLPNAKPPPCDLRVPKSCQSPTPVQYTLLFTAFALMSIGAGGIRPCSLAFGADQIDCKDNPKREDHHGWRVGFGIPVVLMLISTLSFIVAYPLYYKMKVEKSLFTSLCQVVLAAWKNRKVTLPDSRDRSWYYRNDKKVATPTKNLRFFNKACILTKPEDTNKDPWCNCTVEQVEELKALIRVIPLWIDTSLKTLKYQQRHWDSSTS
ncbi:NRT1/ PTR family 1.2-like protein [Tanacetum coccineum]